MFMKFVDFNPKEPKVSNRYGNILDGIKKIEKYLSHYLCEVISTLNQ